MLPLPFFQIPLHPIGQPIQRIVLLLPVTLLQQRNQFLPLQAELLLSQGNLAIQMMGFQLNHRSKLIASGTEEQLLLGLQLVLRGNRLLLGTGAAQLQIAIDSARILRGDQLEPKWGALQSTPGFQPQGVQPKLILGLPMNMLLFRGLLNLPKPDNFASPLSPDLLRDIFLWQQSAEGRGLLTCVFPSFLFPPDLHWPSLLVLFFPVLLLITTSEHRLPGHHLVMPVARRHGFHLVDGLHVSRSLGLGAGSASAAILGRRRLQVFPSPVGGEEGLADVGRG